MILSSESIAIMAIMSVVFLVEPEMVVIVKATLSQTIRFQAR